MKKLKWTDIYDIAISLSEKHQDIDIININFVDMKKLILDLDEFEDNPNRSNEKILEAIQMAWIEESE